MMKDVLSNVDSVGTTLLHLAVDSGSPAVSNLFWTISSIYFIVLWLIGLTFSLSLFQAVELCLNNGAIILQPKVSDQETTTRSDVNCTL